MAGPDELDITTKGQLAVSTTTRLFGWLANRTTGTILPPSLLRPISNEYNVKAYGAVWDGSTHPLSGYYATLAEAQAVYPTAVALSDEIDWAATQLAVNTAWANGGGRVVLPDGVGRWNRTLLVPTGSDSNTDRTLSLQGQGMVLQGEPKGGRRNYGTLIVYTATDGTDAIQAVSTSGSRTWPCYNFSDFALIGPDTYSPRTTTSGNGINIGSPDLTKSTHRTYMHNVFVSHFFGSGKAGLYIKQTTGSQFSKVHAEYCDIGWKLTDTYNNNAHLNCHARANASYGVYMADGEGTWTGGAIESNEKTGLYCESVSGWIFNAVHFENNNSTAAANKYGVELIGLTGRTVANLALNLCRFAGTGDGGRIYMTGVSGGTVQNITLNAGYNAGVSDPKVILNNAFVANVTFLNFCGPDSVTDNAGDVTYLWQGAWTARGGGAAAPRFVTGTSDDTGFGGSADTALIAVAGVTTAQASSSGFRLNGGTYNKKWTSSIVAIDPPSIAAGASATVTFTLTGAAAGDTVVINPPASLEAGLVFGGAYVSAADTVTIYLHNITAGAIDGASRNWRYRWDDWT